MTLNDQQLDRYARHIVLRDIGGAGQSKLLSSHVLLIGAGGIGCPAIQYLAAAGVGTISVVDDDVVALSNLQRQILYSDHDIGTAKVDAAGAAAARLNPDITFNAIAPGPFPGMLDALLASEEGRAGVSAATVVGRVGEPEDIGAACIYLASRAGSYVTGAVLPVDGGFLVGRYANI